ncbi:uncharacterized protein CANTADRAFT_271188 [Suhomyces tanzawaensis NRRL Y-17324]|uniref:Uncharacterized protein n=1 Tax=Suhomyces tanzawaensis NRRL Y-17324 TaxID=984487 RepID=A0A1E4SGL3_9ASCO|nr:uncharacterized protein CANTADRAFT_271188 [Suhomyces tanzawaensis NRRL Y-17324]ODV78653.1 hypothetical protein CANTADRAFT_271188 [Suhomyces tanzawaensis NRRL Y-17324]
MWCQAPRDWNDCMRPSSRLWQPCELWHSHVTTPFQRALPPRPVMWFMWSVASGVGTHAYHLATGTGAPEKLFLQCPANLQLFLACSSPIRQSLVPHTGKTDGRWAICGLATFLLRSFPKETLSPYYFLPQQYLLRRILCCFSLQRQGCVHRTIPNSIGCSPPYCRG